MSTLGSNGGVFSSPVRGGATFSTIEGSEVGRRSHVRSTSKRPLVKYEPTDLRSGVKEVTEGDGETRVTSE